jgi:hypothetical protein
MVYLGDFEFTNIAGDVVRVRVQVATGDALAQAIGPLVHRARKSKTRRATTAGGALVVTIAGSK